MTSAAWPLCVGAAAYPEGHVETRDLARDLQHLKEKVDAGADFLVTQLFFENAHYFRFVERARAAGIGVPVLPGVMPMTNVEQIERFTAMCGASIPPPLRAAMEVRRDDAEAALQLGVAYAGLQCPDLPPARGAGHPLLHAQPLDLDARHRGGAPGCRDVARPRLRAAVRRR